MNKLEISKELIDGFEQADYIVREGIYFTLQKLVNSKYEFVRVVVCGNGLESRTTGNFEVTIYAELDKHYSESELQVFLLYCVSNIACRVNLHTNVVNRLSERELTNMLLKGVVIYGQKIFD